MRTEVKRKHPNAACAGRLIGLLAMSLFSGCSMALMDPKGAIGIDERSLILISLGVMLLVVVPVICLTLYFAWRYRASNKQATYAPTWAHSTPIEVVVWSIPCLIVLALACLIWKSTHTLDPYRPLDSSVKPVRVQVVAMNWKWLFIYPDYGVATLNHLVIPAGTPISFDITADSLMNSFFIPRLGSQVYAMPGMQTELHLIADSAGTYRGMSAAYSGAGFSDMHFSVDAMLPADFGRWLDDAKQHPQTLDLSTYQSLALPSTKLPSTVFGNVLGPVFESAVVRYMAMPKDVKQPGTTQMPAAHPNNTIVGTADSMGAMEKNMAQHDHGVPMQRHMTME